MSKYHKLEKYFNQLLTLDDESRTVFLQELRDNDPEIYQELLALYGQHDEASQYFAQIEEKINDSLFEKEDMSGQTFGNYQLEELIGSGGMANVYKATRTDGTFQREAAIKFTKRGLDSENVLSRFQYERKILGRLKHENIAQIYDAGMTEEGLPYFVMEYVDGTDIISYAKGNKLNIRQRLNLFQQVCKAVEFAHKNLVIHRDIKPTNILIDRDEKVKLTDFGIAKILNPEEDSELTQLHSQVMTPGYASPEQSKSDFINTTSDVFQLGLLLYELISGEKAYDKEKKEYQFNFDKKLVPSEIISIIQTATRDEPEERYNTAEVLLQDINNFLENRPVKARGNHAGYVFKKFISRHKWAVALTITTLLLIAIGLAKYLHDVNEARKFADYNAIQSNAITNFFLQALQTQYPVYANGDTLNIFDMINEIEDNLKDDHTIFPRTRKQFYNIIGEIYQGYSAYKKATNNYHKALSINPEEFKYIHYNFGYDHILRVSIGDVFLDLGEYDSAIYYYQKAIEEPENNELYIAYAGLADAFLFQGNHNKADSAYNLCYESLLKTNQNDITKALVMGRYGSFLSRYYLSEKADLIDSLFVEAIDIFNSPFEYRKEPEFEIFSETEYWRNEEIKGELNRKHRPDAYARLVNYYGIFLFNIKDFDNAIKYFKHAYEANLDYYGENNVRSLDNLNNVAVILRQQGNTEQAIKTFKQCWQMSQQNKAIHTSQALNYYHNYAVSFYDLNKFEECLAAIDTVLDLRAQYAPDGIFAINHAKSFMARCYNQLGRSNQAIKLFQQVIEDHQNTFGEEGNSDLEARMEIFKILADEKKAAKAENLYKQNKKIITRRLGKEHTYHHKNNLAYSRALLMLEDYKKSISFINPLLDDSMSVAKKAIYQLHLAESKLEIGQTAEAENLYQKIKMDSLTNRSVQLSIKSYEERKKNKN